MLSELAKMVAVISTTVAMCAPVGASDWYVASGHIVYVEATYMPSSIPFRINEAASATCGAGLQLVYNAPNADNAKAVFAALLAARASGTQIRLYGIDAGCVVQFVYFG